MVIPGAFVVRTVYSQAYSDLMFFYIQWQIATHRFPRRCCGIPSLHVACLILGGRDLKRTTLPVSPLRKGSSFDSTPSPLLGETVSHWPVIKSSALDLRLSSVLHLLDFTLYMTYLVVLGRYALSPKSTDEEPRLVSPTISEWLVMLYSLARVLSRWSFNTVPFMLILLALSLSFVPLYGLSDVSYSVVLMALSLHILQLHLCYPPTPMALFPHEQTFPLATLLWHGLSRIFIPVTAFFMPALLVTIFLLSLSLSDALGSIIPLSINSSPLETRSAFVALFTVMFGLLICSLVMLVLVYPSLSSRPQAASPWDRYSEAIGLDARRAFTKVVVTYSASFVFIPPFNILQIVFVRIPTWILHLAMRKDLYVSLRTLDRALWRVTVGLLCSCLAASFWLWALFW